MVATDEASEMVREAFAIVTLFVTAVERKLKP
jgi:hypothetical protein